MGNELKLKLPNGEILSAAVYSEGPYPSITVFWEHGSKREAICFAEFNPEKSAGKQVCIGAYTASEDDVVYYESYVNPAK